jgi:hypothetical protein
MIRASGNPNHEKANVAPPKVSPPEQAEDNDHGP